MLHDIDPLMPMAAIRVGDWKLVTGQPCVEKKNCGWYPPPQLSELMFEEGPNPFGVWLYNITADPTELNDLHELYPEVVDQLQKRIAW